MAKIVKHKFVSAIPDGADTGLVRPSNWNDDHDLAGIAESGANTDITSLQGITGGISTPDFIQYDTTAVSTIALGKERWNVDTGTLAFGIVDGTYEVNIGQQMYAQVVNAEAVTITSGQAVYLYQATGNKASVKLASNLGDSTSAKTLGLVVSDITAGGTGFVITQGVLGKLDTSAFAEGATLYLGATAGSWTSTKPKAPNHLVYIGVVERANAGNGQIYVRPQNGYELDEIHDVQINSPANGQTILYDESTSLWKNANLTAGTGVSVTNGAASVTIANTGVTGLTAGTGVSVSGSTGNVTVTNTAPDQTVALNAGTGISTSGTYPNFTITNTAPDQTVSLNAGTGISTSGTYPNFTVTNTAPDQVVSLTGSGSTTVTGTYPNFTISSTSSSGVTSVGATAPIASSGGTTPTISITQATTSTDGYLSSTDWNTFNNKQPAGTYVTSVGATSPVTSTGGTTPTIAMPAANGSTNGYLTSTDWTTFNGKGNGTVTSVAALTLGTTGTDLSSTVANGTTTPVITLNVPTASAANRGALSSTDWSTFNGKQAALVSGTNIKTINGSSILGSGDLAVSAAAGGSTTQVQYNNAGALAGSANFIHDGTNVGIGTTPDGTSWLQIAGGTTTKASLELIAGTLMTTPDDGSIEYDGGIFYGTPNANNRGVILTENFVARTGTKTMTSNTSLQSVFGGGTGGLTNGALSVQGTETYFFECSLNLSSMSATSGNMGFSIVGAGTATFTSAAWHAFGLDATTQTTAAAAGTSFWATETSTGNIVTAATGTAVSVFIKGIFRINAAGTIIPSVQLTTAAAAVIGANCWFKCYPVGSNTIVSVGNWS